MSLRPCLTCLPDHAWPLHFLPPRLQQLYYSTMGGRTGPTSRRDTRGTRQSSTQQWRSLQRDWQNCSETFEHLVTKKREMSIRTNRLSVRFKMWRLIFDLFSETLWCAAASPTNYKLSYVIVYQLSESENNKLQSRAESWNRNSSNITQTILGATCTRWVLETSYLLRFSQCSFLLQQICIESRNNSYASKEASKPENRHFNRWHLDVGRRSC